MHSAITTSYIVMCLYIVLRSHKLFFMANIALFSLWSFTLKFFKYVLYMCVCVCTASNTCYHVIQTYHSPVHSPVSHYWRELLLHYPVHHLSKVCHYSGHTTEWTFHKVKWYHCLLMVSIMIWFLRILQLVTVETIYVMPHHPLQNLLQ